MPDATVPYHLARFVTLHPQVEAVVQPVGLATWDLFLIDVTGLWDRDEFPTEASARDAASALKIPVHAGWDDARLSRRANGRDHWNTPDGQRRAL